MAQFARAWEGRLAGDAGPADTKVSERLEQLPGVVAGALLRHRLELCFRRELHGELFTYAGEHGLRVHFLRPRAGASGPGAGACCAFVHGGGWLGGAPSQFYPYAEALAARGVAAACCEVRSLLTHPGARPAVDAVGDVRRCVGFLQERAAELGIRRVVLAGASSGGQLAAMAALERPGPELAGLVLFNPVLDLSFAEGWWRRRPALWLGSWLLRLRCGASELERHSPLRQVGNLSCPTLVLHGTADRLVPMAEVDAFCKSMQQSGNACTVVPFPGEDHFFFNKRVSPANFSRCVDLLGSFLSSAGAAAPEAPSAAAA